MRARAQIEERESSGESQIVITELPYQVNMELLNASIVELAMAKKIEGISDARNHRSEEEMRVVMELKRD